MHPLSQVAIVALLVAGSRAATEAGEFKAANPAELSAQLQKVQPGDTIVLADGVWRDAPVEITRGGNATAPVRIRAQTPGGVTFSGASSLTFAAPYVQVDGVVFKGGALARGAVVQFNSDHGRLTNAAIIDYSPADGRAGYYYVYFKGNRNRLDRCLIMGKKNPEPVIGNDLRGSRFNTVERCYFKDIPWVNQNGREIFRIWGYGGNEELGPDGAFFTIESNLFEHADGEGMEIISLKSNRNVVRNNTIRASRGGITNRSGNYNTIEGNFILGENQPGTYGLRVTGQHHRILHNYIEGVSSFGIRLMSGELFEQALTEKFSPILREGTVHGRVPRYNQPRYTVIAYNTIVETGEAALMIGSDYKSGWPAAQRVLLPEDCTIAHNVIRTKGVAVNITTPDRTAPLDRLTFAPNFYEENVVIAGKIEGDAAEGGRAARSAPHSAEGFVARPQLELVRDAAGVLRPKDATLAQSSAAAAPAAFSKEPSPFRPLKPEEVGPTFGR